MLPIGTLGLQHAVVFKRYLLRVYSSRRNGSVSILLALLYHLVDVIAIEVKRDERTRQISCREHDVTDVYIWIRLLCVLNVPHRLVVRVDLKLVSQSTFLT